MAIKLPESDLVQLNELDRPFNKDEMKLVADQVKLIVFGEDERARRKIGVRLAQRARSDMNSVIQLEGDMIQCFDRIPTIEEDQLPMILCKDGHQTREAFKIMSGRQIEQPGLLILDHNMSGLSAIDAARISGFEKTPHPTGMGIFEEFNGRTPANMARILQSSNPPDGIEDNLEAGVLDDCTGKIDAETFPVMLRSFLKKLLAAR